MIVCPQCGGSFSEGDAFCRFCGCAAPEVVASETASDETANPYAVGAQTPNPRLPNETESREVPANIVAAIKMCITQRRAKGRSSRAEFWYWNIVVFLTVVLPFLVFVIPYGGEPQGVGALVTFAASLWGIVAAIPSLDVAVRRFHDVGLMGITAYALLLLIFPGFLLPAFMSEFFSMNIDSLYEGCVWICLLTILIVGLIPGTKGPNKYGPPPIKRKTAAEDKTEENEVSR